MTVSTFGVTADSVRRHFFPQISAFSTSSSPTSTTVAEVIDGVAADIEGKLAKKGVTASAITDSTTTAYKWCSKTLRIAAAVELVRTMAGQDKEIAKAWQAELDARLKDLDENGVSVLGGGATASETSDTPDGPTTHIDEYSLDTADTADMSTSEPIFRRSDIL